MPTLTIKNVPQGLYKKLKARAAQNRRSLNGEVIVCLEEILEGARLDAATFLAQARELRRRSKRVLSQAEVTEAKIEGRL